MVMVSLTKLPMVPREVYLLGQSNQQVVGFLIFRPERSSILLIVTRSSQDYTFHPPVLPVIITEPSLVNSLENK